MSSRALQCCSVHATVVSLREHPEMWHGVCEPLWMHPYCHHTKEAHQGNPGRRVALSHQHCLPEGFLRRPACLPIHNPKPPTHTGFLFQFCFCLLSPLPRALGPLSAPRLQLLNCSMVVPGSERAPADGSPHV